MPTPFDLLRDPATLVLLALFAGLALWEFAAPGRPLPQVRGWTARALVSFVVYFLLSFQHANVRTPRWLGYLVQRPEMHTVHHARGIHHYNYADLPFIDALFGTYRNPRDYAHATGFWHGASARVIDMLLLRDVSEPRKEH